jgi:hypothetical protein
MSKPAGQSDPHHVLSFLFGKEATVSGGEELEEEDLQHIVPSAAQQVQPLQAGGGSVVVTATTTGAAAAGPSSLLITPQGLAAPITPKAGSPGPTTPATAQSELESPQVVADLCRIIVKLQDLLVESRRTQMTDQQVEDRLRAIVSSGGPASRYVDVYGASSFTQTPQAGMIAGPRATQPRPVPTAVTTTAIMPMQPVPVVQRQPKQPSLPPPPPLQ